MKNKVSLGLLLALFPTFVAAQDGSLSFTPPPGDYSVVFLGNIFGVVDGVLHGTGSQIMGAIFSVFNSAVLALGGIVIMYTLLVSTMNTAHEGQMLGQKWSSIWIPVRSTIGLALLIPKASGYCLMQVFVMWIVVQGIGAADKIWNAALGYLSRGGVIVQAQMDSQFNVSGSAVEALIQGNPPAPGVGQGAQTILAGQVCMIGLQKALEKRREDLLKQKQNGSGDCVLRAYNHNMSILCDHPVPDFLSSVNFIEIQNQYVKDSQNSQLPPQNSPPQVMLPNFTDLANPYSMALAGICGTIEWNLFSSNVDQANIKGNIPAVTDNDIETAKMSRVIALQQLYMDLAQIAQVMVNNSPPLNPEMKASDPFSAVANQEFGVPQNLSGKICTDVNDPNCYSWGSTTSGSAPLFSGTEFQGAIADYNAIMLPSLNLINEAKDSTNAQNSRLFIQQASASGWLMAGSYFFDIINLNQAAQGGASLTDKDSGLDGSYFDPNNLVSCDYYPVICDWFPDKTNVQAISVLINGSNIPPAWVQDGKKVPKQISTPSIKPGNPPPVPPIQSGYNSSTVYGFTSNSIAVKTPGQPGQNPLMFDSMINISPDTAPYHLPEASFGCGSVTTFIFTFCLGGLLGDLFYNVIFRNIYNMFLDTIGPLIEQVINAFLMLPIQGMAFIFQTGLKMVSTPGANPVVALAQMGTYYINFAANMWLLLIQLSIVSSLFGIFGLFVFALIGLGMPIILAWMGVMVMIGFTTAYYIPLLPYIIFTFGAIAWIMAVIEAMVAAPIVALGITHPEGHDAFGKGEQAIMILMNVFLRPAMMIIGYIAGISLSYVGVWILNAGFDHAVGFMQGSSQFGTRGEGLTASDQALVSAVYKAVGSTLTSPPDVNVAGVGNISGGYNSWAGVFAFFFSILIYTTMYLTIVQKSFTLIVTLPDKVLRWIGGAPESVGQEVERWAGEAGKQMEEGGKKTQEGKAAMDKQMAGYVGKAKKALSDKTQSGGNISAEGE